MTPRWLVIVLPQRALVEQTVDVIEGWLRNLALDVPVHVLMGGEDPGDRDWKSDPERERIFVGTLDMVLSQLLMREAMGSAVPCRSMWMSATLDPAELPKALAARVVSEHRSGTRTLVVLNTVKRATEVFDELDKNGPGAELVLLHSRFRPRDRQEQNRRALAPPGSTGSIVVATQVLEAGVDGESA